MQTLKIRQATGVAKGRLTMQILSTSTNWLRSQTAAPSDFKPQQGQQQPEPKPEPGLTIGKAATIGTAVGAGVGAVAGGAWAGHSVSNDFEYFDYVSTEIPLASSGPSVSGRNRLRL